MSQYNLSGKVAVITGASKGLGKAMALALVLRARALRSQHEASSS
jgi:NAD(P)-dependent dehydrogenase (short-subunit alcohol dehydrogenase family)